MMFEIVEKATCPDCGNETEVSELEIFGKCLSCHIDDLVL